MKSDDGTDERSLPNDGIEVKVPAWSTRAKPVLIGGKRLRLENKVFLYAVGTAFLPRREAALANSNGNLECDIFLADQRASAISPANIKKIAVYGAVMFGYIRVCQPDLAH